MDYTETNLATNSLAFIALSNEYCQALETASQTPVNEFVDSMLRLLPRIYISASDLNVDTVGIEEPYLPGVLEEDYYENIRSAVGMVMGEYDTYLEVFEDDMKFSDTPIAASVSEALADIFQELYNLLENVKDAPNEIINEMLSAVKDDFASFLSQTICNVLRAINAVKYNSEAYND